MLTCLCRCLCGHVFVLRYSRSLPFVFSLRSPTSLCGFFSSVQVDCILPSASIPPLSSVSHSSSSFPALHFIPSFFPLFTSPHPHSFCVVNNKHVNNAENDKVHQRTVEDSYLYNLTLHCTVETSASSFKPHAPCVGYNELCMQNHWSALLLYYTYIFMFTCGISMHSMNSCHLVFWTVGGHKKHDTHGDGFGNCYNNENMTNKAPPAGFFFSPSFFRSHSLPLALSSSCPSCHLPPVIIVAPLATADAVIIIAVVGRSLHQGCTVIWTNCDEMSLLLLGWKTLVETHRAGSGIKNVDTKGKGIFSLSVKDGESDVFLNFVSCGCCTVEISHANTVRKTVLND